MENENKGTEEVVEETTTQEVPPATEEQKPEEETPKDERKKAEIDEEELALLRKKATDFDGMVEKQRLAKLAKKDAPKETKPAGEAIDVEEVVSRAAEEAKRVADARIQEFNKSTYEQNLATAYKQFVSKNPWANTDKHIDKISEGFKRGEALTVNELVSQLDKAALENFPDEYRKALEEGVKSKILAEDTNINAGGSGAATSVPSKDTKNVDVSQATQEDIRIANKFFRGDVARYLKSKQARD